MAKNWTNNKVSVEGPMAIYVQAFDINALWGLQIKKFLNFQAVKYLTLLIIYNQSSNQSINKEGLLSREHMSCFL